MTLRRLLPNHWLDAASLDADARVWMRRAAQVRDAAAVDSGKDPTAGLRLASGADAAGLRRASARNSRGTVACGGGSAGGADADHRRHRRAQPRRRRPARRRPRAPAAARAVCPVRTLRRRRRRRRGSARGGRPGGAGGGVPNQRRATLGGSFRVAPSKAAPGRWRRGVGGVDGRRQGLTPLCLPAS